MIATMTCLHCSPTPTGRSLCTIQMMMTTPKRSSIKPGRNMCELLEQLLRLTAK